LFDQSFAALRLKWSPNPGASAVFELHHLIHFPFSSKINCVKFYLKFHAEGRQPLNISVRLPLTLNIVLLQYQPA